MQKKTIRHKTGTVEYNIYTIEEAKKAGIKYTSWREAKEGEYSATDDGYVAICYGKKFLHRGNIKVVFLHYPFGFYSYNEKDGKPGKNIRILFNRVLSKSSTIVRKRKIPVFAMVYLATCDSTEAFKFVYPRSSIHKARYWGRQCLLSTPIIKEIEKQLSELLERRGIAKTDIPKLWQEALTMARKSKNVAGFIRIVENITKAHFPQEKVRTSFRIIRKSTQKGGIIDVIRKEDAKLEKFGDKDDRSLLSELPEVKQDDPSTVTKQTAEMSVVQERDISLDENENIGHNTTDEEHPKAKN